MSISNDIRALARDGLTTADIARRLGIRYQHAYNVLKADGAQTSPARLTSEERRQPEVPRVVEKPPLNLEFLTARGFSQTSRWLLSEAGELIMEPKLPNVVGVYVFAKDGIAQYVGVATMGLAKRLNFYANSGISQPTNLRLNALIKSELISLPAIDIFTAVPPDFDWNGLPVHGSAGLELGLIKKYALPWNKRSANGLS